MTKDRLKELNSAAMDNLIQAVEKGKSEDFRRFMEFMGKFHKYSFGNQSLIWMQNPEASHVAGFSDWKRKFNRHVNRGSKGIIILAPLVSKDKETGESEIYGFRAVYVFDVAQTSGDPVPEYKTNYNGLTELNIDLVIKSFNIELIYKDDLPGAAGISKNGTIEILNSLPPAEMFSVKIHELAHELLHKKEDRQKLTRTQIETEAEAISFVVCQFAGIDSDNSFSDYILSHKGNKELLIDSMKRITKTAGTIIDKLSKAAA